MESRKTHSKGGAYLEGGAYWKEGAKSNHYGNFINIFEKSKFFGIVYFWRFMNSSKVS